MLSDLDELSLRVRDAGSRLHFREAVLAYRAGAHRAAVNAIWVAVAYDILAKFRELAHAGDAAATAFVTVFDVAVANNNIEQLLRLEGQLLDKAKIDFDFFSESEYEHLTRLKYDRNRSAHPSFTSDSELYAPSGELTRTHIVHAVEFLLSRAPVQGKALITQFEHDLVSTSFPNDPDATIEYVRSRYLERAKPSAIRSLGLVLAKALLRRDVPAWNAHVLRILHSLEAVAIASPRLFTERISPDVARLVDSLDARLLQNAFRMFRHVPAMLRDVGAATKLRLQAVLENFDFATERSNEAFAAAGVPGFEVHAAGALLRADADRRLEVISELPARALVPLGIELLRSSGGWRAAERRFASAVMPLASVFELSDVPALVEAIAGNGQVWDAAGVPAMLAEFLRQAFPGGGLRAEPNWLPLIAIIGEHDLSRRYEDLFAILGIQPPG
jgi:hypothetical protein